MFVNKFVPHYRRAFYERLRRRLKKDDVVVDLVYGDAVAAEALKNDSVRLKWAIYKRNTSIAFGRVTLIYQPVVRLAAAYDLVIVEQANKLLVNYILLFLSKLGLLRLAFWGHGRDFSNESNAAMRLVKRLLTPAAHWWFAYNDLSAEAVRATGFSNSRITSFMNTIDSDELEDSMRRLANYDLVRRCRVLGLQGKNTCIYIGGMYDKKRIPFLLQACDQIRRRVSNFEMIFVGSGADRPLIDAFCSTRSWAVSLGPVFGHDKAVLLSVSKLLLMPGLVGLAVIDSFAAKVPIVTTAVPYHSPEIQYLVSGENGMMLDAATPPDRYAEAVSRLLNDEDALERLRAGCDRAAKTYTMSTMVERVAEGILEALRT